MTLTLDDVHRAVDALYHDLDVSGKEKASAWLNEFQKSVFAWKLSDELLQQNRDVASSYFAAQTMRTKIQFAFHELPPESHHLLRDSLMRHICTAAEENCATLTQLCLALADLALQMASWKMAFRELIQQMSTNVKLIPALLEILSLLPEELRNKSLRLGENRREELMDEFQQVGPMLLQLLIACTEAFGATDPRLYAKILKCFGGWLGVGAIPTVDAARSSLLTSVLCSLGNCEAPSTVHEAASDCICEALVLIEEKEAHVELKQALVHGVHALIQPYHLSVKAEHNDKCLNFCRIFTELAESTVEAIIETPGRGMGSFRTLDIVLVCLENDDRVVANVTFNVWFRLAEFLQTKNDEELMNMFKPYMVKLIAALCRHCRLGCDLQEVLDTDDDFIDFRVRVSELIKEVAFIVGSFDCFRQMFDQLKNQGSKSSWDISEASLFVMCAVADSIQPDEDEVIPEVLGAILDLPDSTHLAVRLTSVRLVGELREWIEHHPQSIEPVLNFLSKCLHQPQLATVAATALQNICSACSDRMGVHFDALAHIVRNMHLFDISDEAAIGLFKGAVLILAKMPFPMISRGVTQLCCIQTGELFQMIQDASEVSPINSLERLTAIFKNLELTVAKGETHPCMDIVREIWPILSETFVKFQRDHRIIESCCRCTRYMIRCVGRQSSPLLLPVVKLIVQLYRVHQHSCYLYLGSVLVDEYSVCPDFHKVLVEMMEALCGPTFVLLDGPDNLRNHPDTVDDLFRLCWRFHPRITVPFLQSPMFKSILQCGLAACSIAHREANESVLIFFKSLVRHSKRRVEDSEIRRELVGACLAEHGASLVINLMNACILCQQSFMIPDLAEVIFELMSFDRRAVLWLEEALKRFPTLSSGGSITATPEQLTDFIQKMTDAKGCGDVRAAVRKLSRLYR